MKRNYLLPIALISLITITGCDLSTASNTSTSNGNKAAVVNTTNTAQTSTNVVTTTNTTNTSDIDISDWLTYTNEEYGFSFKYPGDWTLKVNDVGLISLTNATSNIRAKIFVSENVVETGVDEKITLKFEDGREPLALVSEEFISINGLSSYRAFRQLKKGEPIFNADELNEITRTEIEYTYLSENDLFRVWFTIDGEDTESSHGIVDAIGQSFLM